MGSGASKSPFSTHTVEPQLPLSAGDGHIVHIVGRVAVAKSDVLSSPFGGQHGPAVRVLAKRQDGSTALADRGWVAQSAIDFFVTAGSAKVRVVVPEVDAWAWHLRQTNRTHNICVNGDGSSLVGGGAKHNFQSLAPLPDGMEFWQVCSPSNDSLAAMQKLRGSISEGHAGREDVQRPRMVLEQTLCVGDEVAVIGVLGQTEAGELTISPQLPKGKGQISNDVRVAKSLNGVPAARDAGEDDGAEPRVIPICKNKKTRTMARPRTGNW